MRFSTAIVLAALFAVGGAHAQQRKTVEGMVINIGIVNALTAEHADAQHGVHQGGHGPGMQHVVVSVADAKSGARMAGAEVGIELRDPKGRLQKKALLPMSTAGVPDYSEVFDFGFSGKYDLRVTVRPQGAAKPLSTSFTVNHYIP